MEKIIINDYINNDPLLEENLDQSLECVNKLRLLCPNKTIWLYTGYTWNSIMDYDFGGTDDFDYIEESYIDGLYELRRKIISKCDILVDGRYIDSQRNPSLKWRGSENQRCIDIQKSLKQNEVVLYCE